MKLPSLMLAAATLAGLSASDLTAQVIISEIDFTTTKPGAWIELHNQSPLDFDLSNFSIYQATNTPFRVNDYWWAIPTGTVIKGGDYLRIYWGGKIDVTSPPADKRNIFTGHTTWHFLFGHGFELLDPDQGALALCNTKLNSQMNNAGIFTDWIQWGGKNFMRGQTAVNSKLWASNTTTIPVGATDRSLIAIYSERNRVTPPPLSAYAYDHSPTPLGHNADPLVNKSLGGACSARTAQAYGLVGNGFPFFGNESFSLTISGTQGPAFFESMMLLFSLDSSTELSPMGRCHALKISNLVFFTPPMPTTVVSTTLPTPLHTPASVAGVNIYLQGLVIGPDYRGFTNILQLTTSN